MPYQKNNNPFDAILILLAQGLDQSHIPYMVIGGQAVLLHGRPRLTQDIDLTLGVGPEKIDDILMLSQKLGFTSLVPDPKKFVQQTLVFPAQDEQSKIRIDFIFSYSPYEQQAIMRSEALEIQSYPVRFATAEDLILHKMLAGRPRDYEDVESVMLRQKSKLDLQYVEKWLNEFIQIPDKEALIEQWNDLLGRLGE